jgi:hypothetical protein
MVGPKLEPQMAHKRAIADYSQGSQFARTAAQFTFAANGGAAVAILSFLTAIVKSTAIANSSSQTVFDTRLIARNFAIACVFYVLGVLIAIASMYLFARSKKNWGDEWEDAAFTGGVNFKGKFAPAAQQHEDRAWATIVLSALMLAAGSVCSVLVFF